MLRSASHCKNSPVPVGRVGCQRLGRSIPLPLGETGQHVLRGHRLLVMRAAVACTPRSHSCDCRLDSYRSSPSAPACHPSWRRSESGSVVDIWSCWYTNIFGRDSAAQFHQVLAHGSLARAASANCWRGMRLCLRCIRLPETAIDRQVLALRNPTSIHWRTICSNSSSNSFDSYDRPCRFSKRGVVRDLLIETQSREPAPRQMHAQFLHQFAFAGDAPYR